MKKLFIAACGLLLLQSCKKDEWVPPTHTPGEILFANNKVNVMIISSNGDTAWRNTTGVNAAIEQGSYGVGLYIVSAPDAGYPKLDLSVLEDWPLNPGTYSFHVEYDLGGDTSYAHFNNYNAIGSDRIVNLASTEDHYAKGFFSVTAKTYNGTDSVKIVGDFEGYVRLWLE